MLACRSRFAQHLTSDESFESFPVIETNVRLRFAIKRCCRVDQHSEIL